MPSEKHEDESMLAHQLFAPEQEPKKTVVFLHGIMGSANNWRGFAQLLLNEIGPRGWQILALDLPNHGETKKSSMPACDLACITKKVAQTIKALNIEPHAIVGHSYGGKIAVLLALEFLTHLPQVWVLDSVLGKLHNAAPLESEAKAKTTWQIIEILQQIKWPVLSRNKLVEQLVALGVSRQIAAWMTTNLKSGEESGLVLKFDPKVIKAMLADFLQTDLWPKISELGSICDIHLVAAEHGGRLLDKDEERLKELLGAKGFFHVLKNAGHFLHADNPAGLLRIMEPYFT